MQLKRSGNVNSADTMFLIQKMENTKLSIKKVAPSDRQECRNRWGNFVVRKICRKLQEPFIRFW